ncbi:carboxylesterase family protein, partial [Streptosporangium canum]
MTGRTRAAAGILTALASVSMLMAGALPAHAGERSGPVVATASGKVQGADQGGVHRFRGIPYAAPPVGERRWQPPQPASSWTGTRDATKAGPACLQPEAPDMPKGTPQSEDCLTLEVTTPARPGEGRPVMVWVPGGGFITGAGSIYDPARPATTGDLNGAGITTWPRLGAADRAIEFAPEAVRPINLTSSPRLKPGDSSPRGLDLPASQAIAVPVKA